MNIFPQTELSETEEAILVNTLGDPTVKKYLHLLAYRIGTQLSLGDPIPNEDPNEFLRRRAALRGQLDVLETLLSINAAENDGV